ISLGEFLGVAEFDAAASVVIGLILAAVAVILVYESRGLLIGEGADPQMLASIRALTEADPGVERLNQPLTMYFGPHTVLLAMDVQFRKELSANDVTAVIDRLERRIRSVHPDRKQLFIRA